MPRALITGITGQDGHYLSEHLLKKGYEVYGLIRGQANPKRADARAHAARRPHRRWRPARPGVADERHPEGAAGRGLQPRRHQLRHALVEPAGADRRDHRPRRAARARGDPPHDRRLALALEVRRTASSSTRPRAARCSARCARRRRTRATPFHPRSPYGVAKAYAHYITVNYRESYNIFACSGILFNHESPRRGPEFVDAQDHARRRAHQARAPEGAGDGQPGAAARLGLRRRLRAAMHLMLQQPEPDDYVIGTGETHQIKECARDRLRARRSRTGEDYVRSDPQFMRPAEVDLLIADATKARKKLRWKPSVIVRAAHRHDGRRRSRHRIPPAGSDGLSEAIAQRDPPPPSGRSAGTRRSTSGHSPSTRGQGSGSHCSNRTSNEPDDVPPSANDVAERSSAPLSEASGAGILVPVMFRRDADVDVETMTNDTSFLAQLEQRTQQVKITLANLEAERTRIEGLIARLQPLVPHYDALLDAERAINEREHRPRRSARRAICRPQRVVANPGSSSTSPQPRVAGTDSPAGITPRNPVRHLR